MSRKENLNKAVKILKSGGVVVYPTDTAYGLAVDATNAAAVRRLYQLKGRDFQKPIHVIPPTKSWIEKLVKLDIQAKKLINRLMPGPLTLVLPIKVTARSFQMLSARTHTLGIRRPDHPLALDLAALLQKPITTTSANRSGQASAYSVAEVKKQFQSSKIRPDFYLDGGKLKQIRPSTVVEVKKRVRILRPGPISETKIKNVLKRS